MEKFDITFSHIGKYNDNCVKKHNKKVHVPIAKGLQSDEFILSSQKSSNDADKNGKTKNTLKILSATTLSVATGLLVYKFAKGKNLSELFNKTASSASTQAKASTAQVVDVVSPKTADVAEQVVNVVSPKKLDVAEQVVNVTPPKITALTEQATKVNPTQSKHIVDSISDIEIAKIRKGVTGKIRTESELTNKDIVKLVDSQLLNTKPEEIKNLISSFPQEDQIVVKKLLNELTQFGNMESMDDIAKALESTVGNSQAIFCQNKNTLSDVMHYLCSSKNSFGAKNAATTSFTFNIENSTVLLDEILLKELESNKTLLDKLKTNIENIKIITPESWITGINPFNQTKDMKQIVESALIRYKAIKSSNPSISDSNAITDALRLPLFERLNKLGIDTSKVNFIQKTDSLIDIDSKYFAELISRQLNHPTMNEQQLEKILNKFHKDYHPYIREMLAHSLELNSPKSMSIDLKNIHKKILQANGGTDKGIYYVIPESPKSYSLVSMQYQLTNDIPSSKILSKYQAIHELPKDAQKLIILDDVAASGESLIYNVEQLDGCKLKDQLKEIIALPIISTEKAAAKFNEKAVANMSGRDIESFMGSSWYKSLSEDDQAILEKIMYGSGYNQSGCCITFPYMAPDNNITFFASEFAKMFTLNGQGVKNGDYAHLVEKNLRSA